jgi:hypothetical protein
VAQNIRGSRECIAQEGILTSKRIILKHKGEINLNPIYFSAYF